jgi:hypothetical protein
MCSGIVLEGFTMRWHFGAFEGWIGFRFIDRKRYSREETSASYHLNASQLQLHSLLCFVILELDHTDVFLFQLSQY